MRILGIDYGTKRIGLALSDETETIANPYKVVVSKDFLDIIVAEAKNLGIETIVIGESRDFTGRENPLMEAVHKFSKKLEGAGLKVFLEPEYSSSVEASRFQGVREDIDASAAAIILQRYLDKQKAK